MLCPCETPVGEAVEGGTAAGRSLRARFRARSERCGVFTRFDRPEVISLLSKAGFASRRFGQGERPGGLSPAA
jgi:hypothetical protein